MASLPPGMLSFLYNVMHNTEINKEFRYEPYEVMEFFQLTDEQRELIGDAGEDLARERVKKETAFAMKYEHAEKMLEKLAEAPSTKGLSKAPDELITARTAAIPRFPDMLNGTEVQKIADSVFDKFAKRITKQLLEEVRRELKLGFGRFW